MTDDSNKLQKFNWNVNFYKWIKKIYTLCMKHFKNKPLQDGFNEVAKVSLQIVD